MWSLSRWSALWTNNTWEPQRNSETDRLWSCFSCKSRDEISMGDLCCMMYAPWNDPCLAVSPWRVVIHSHSLLLGEEHRLERGSRACVQHQNAEDFWELKQTTFSGPICLTMFDPLNQYKTSSKIHVDWQRTFATEPDTVGNILGTFWEHVVRATPLMWSQSIITWFVFAGRNLVGTDCSHGCFLAGTPRFINSSLHCWSNM